MVVSGGGRCLGRMGVPRFHVGGARITGSSMRARSPRSPRTYLLFRSALAHRATTHRKVEYSRKLAGCGSSRSGHGNNLGPRVGVSTSGAATGAATGAETGAETGADTDAALGKATAAVIGAGSTVRGGALRGSGRDGAGGAGSTTSSLCGGTKGALVRDWVEPSAYASPERLPSPRDVGSAGGATPWVGGNGRIPAMGRVSGGL